MNNVEPEIIKNRNTAKNDFDENIFLKSLTEIFDLVIPNANNIKMKGSTSKIVIFVLTANPKDIELKIIYLIFIFSLPNNEYTSNRIANNEKIL
tara:strand:+ start:521 stop:802 length:282 start_codon:yes stop_codon:yes gene_type:complete